MALGNVFANFDSVTFHWLLFGEESVKAAGVRFINLFYCYVCCEKCGCGSGGEKKKEGQSV